MHLTYTDTPLELVVEPTLDDYTLEVARLYNAHPVKFLTDLSLSDALEIAGVTVADMHHEAMPIRTAVVIAVDAALDTYSETQAGPHALAT